MARFLLVLLILAATKNLLNRFNHSFQRKLIVAGSTFGSNATIGAKDDIAIPLRTLVDRYRPPNNFRSFVLVYFSSFTSSSPIIVFQLGLGTSCYKSMVAILAPRVQVPDLEGLGPSDRKTGG